MSTPDQHHGHEHTHDHEHDSGPDAEQSEHAEQSHAGHEAHEHAGHSDHAGHGGHSDHSGHGGHAGHGDHGDHVGMFRRLFWGSLVLAVPTVLLSPMFADLVGYQVPEFPGASWLPPILGTILYFWFGRPFLTGAFEEIRSRQPGMMLLVTLAITVAFVASWGATLELLPHHLDFWWELALLVVIMLLGHWIEMRSLVRTTSALDSLATLLPDEAERVEGEGANEVIAVVSPSDLRVGDVILVRPGGSVAADGRVVSGSASMDESMITGESLPVRRETGATVVAGTIATDSGLRVEVTAVGEQTALAGIQKLVADAQASSSRAQRLADKAAGWLFWFALGSAVVTFIVWASIGLPEDGLIRTITVLVIACPHALGLAIPLVISISTERAAKAGVLVKDRLSMETMRNVDSVLFDKTGTLTKGQPTVTAVEPASDSKLNADEVLRLAAAAEADSEHPLAQAIVRAAEKKGLALPRSSEFSSHPAEGVTAVVDGMTVHVGGPALLAREGVTELPVADEWRGHGAIILHVIVDGIVVGGLSLADEIREESRAAIDALHERNIEVVMITGDAEAVANSVAAELGIDRVYAGVRPEDKASKVAQLQAEGRKVAMVGDGVNDAPALAQADVGIAIGAGTDVAIGSAGIILASDDPRAVLSIIELSKATYRKSVQNLAWGAGYNLLAVPLAAGVLAPIGFVLPMSVGAVLMSASTVVVALNAQLLRGLDLAPERLAPTTEQHSKA